jgi:hypothetical protein
MRVSRTYGSVRGALSNERPYRDSNFSNEISERANHAALAPCNQQDEAEVGVLNDTQIMAENAPECDRRHSIWPPARWNHLQP